MTQTTMYTYLGTNGTICSPVHLEDVYYIREQYKSLKNWREVYENYKNIISQNTFKDVWVGKTWKHIHHISS